MNPIAVFRHAPSEGPGYFANVVASRGLPWRLIAIDAGEAVPATPEGFSGLVFMGGPMSVNDDLPWIPHTLALIRRAVAAGIPVLGHCLGGQLMAKALGGTVARNPVKEIGWGEVRVTESATARHWFGDITAFQAFHWHGETFSIPPGAERILGSAHCANQAFALGPNLGMQCHVEMTEAMIRTWCEVGAGEIAAAMSTPPDALLRVESPPEGAENPLGRPGEFLESPAVQSAAHMQALAAAHLPSLQRCAERLYDRWLGGLRT